MCIEVVVHVNHWPADKHTTVQDQEALAHSSVDSL